MIKEQERQGIYRADFFHELTRVRGVRFVERMATYPMYCGDTFIYRGPNDGGLIPKIPYENDKKQAVISEEIMNNEDVDLESLGIFKVRADGMKISLMSFEIPEGQYDYSSWYRHHKDKVKEVSHEIARDVFSKKNVRIKKIQSYEKALKQGMEACQRRR